MGRPLTPGGEHTPEGTQVLRADPDDRVINLDALTYAGNLENLKELRELVRQLGRGGGRGPRRRAPREASPEASRCQEPSPPSTDHSPDPMTNSIGGSHWMDRRGPQ